MARMAVASALGAALALAACGQRERPAPDAPPLATPSPSLLSPPPALRASATDVFVARTQSALHVEAETSRLAAARTRNAAVRQFARTIMREAGLARSAFDGLAAGVRPAAVSDPSAALTAHIRDAPPAALDARYLDAFIDTRADAIEEWERYAQSGEAAALRRWAAETLPVARARLLEAETLRQAVNLAPG